MAERTNEEALKRAIGHFEEARQAHDEFVSDVEKRYKTYRGVLENTSKAAEWTSKAHPPYIQHIVETSLASMIDDRLKYQIKPNASIALADDPSAAERAKKGARAHQILFDWQIKADAFNEIQRPFILQNSIAGLTVAKTFWTKREERRRSLVPVNEPLRDEMGDEIIGMDGQPVTTTRLEEKEGWEVVYDGPTTEVRDIRDWIWTPNAVSLSKSPYIIDRVWKLPEEVWDGFQDGGPFGPSRGGWSEKDCRDLLAVTKDTSSETLVTREQDLFNIERTKGLVEIWEVWDNVKKTVTVIANRGVLLSHREGFPFFHNDYPFVTCTTQPDLFRIPGISQVEKIAHIQTLIWDIQNQSLDNLRLVNNAIAMFRPDIEDVDAYEFYPGARWLVEDPSQVQMWTPDPMPAEVSSGRESLLKGDMQNLAGGFPFSSGTDSQFVDQKTATGASIVSSLAQRSMDLAKQQLYAAWRKVGRQRMILNQQFIREPTVAPVMGLDSEDEVAVIMPELLQGDYDFALEPISDAMMKQEDQASAQALLQIIMAAFPIITAAAQNGSATPLNLDAFIEDTLKAFGKEDYNRYFSKKAPQVMPPTSGLGGGLPPVPAGAQAPMGVTGQGSIDPAVSPSSQMSLSPMAALQRAQALDRS
jgi:hypothetical protein